MSLVRALLADERGQALVEFALTIPVVCAVLFGIVDFGRALYAYDIVGSAARLGTRYAMVRGSSCPTAPACTVDSAHVQTYVRSAIGGFDTGSLTVTTTWPPASGCPGLLATPGCPVNVKVTYPFAFLISLPLTITMSASSQLVISQ